MSYDKMGGGKNEGRQSNFELLRIVAMFLVLIVHADFYSLGRPTFEEAVAHPLSSIMRYVVQSLSLVCVNVYIIISGYFGIKLKAKSVLNFIFLVLFWRVFINVLFVIFGQLHLTENLLGWGGFLKLCIPGFDDWFVLAYILLLFFAPILNSFIEKCTLRSLWVFVIAYEGAQVLFSWFLHVWNCFGGGYSLLSFVGLYLLGAAIRRTSSRVIRHPFLLYFLISAIVGIVCFLSQRFFPGTFVENDIMERFDSYNGFFILTCSALLFLGFKQLSFKSWAVNYIAASSFAVYLMHMHPLMRPVYSSICRYLFENYGTFEYICLISMFIVGVFFAAVAIDLLRRWLWNKIAETDSFKSTCTKLTYLTRG